MLPHSPPTVLQSKSVSESVVASTTIFATLNFMHNGAPSVLSVAVLGNQHTLRFPAALPLLSPSHMSWWSVHLGLAAALGDFHQTRTSRSAAMFCQRSTWKNRHDSRNATHPHFHALSHPVLSRIALLSPLHPSVRFDEILLDRCLRPHMCLSSDIFRTLESQI